MKATLIQAILDNHLEFPHEDSLHIYNEIDERANRYREHFLPNIDVDLLCGYMSIQDRAREVDYLEGLRDGIELMCALKGLGKGAHALEELIH